MKKKTIPNGSYWNAEGQWQKYAYRNLWQHPLWAGLQSAVGRQTFFLSTGNAYALVVRHALPFNLCWLEIPRGPLFESKSDLDELIKQLKTRAKEEKAIFVRLSPYQSLKAYDYQLIAYKGDHHPEASLVIDLSQSEERILAQMKPKGRYNIKIAQKHGIQVEVSDDAASFYNILKKTGNRDGFGIHPQSYYEKMLETLGKNAQLLVAKYKDQVIAGGIFVYLDEGGIYYYGASDHHFRQYMAPYLIQWTAILEAKKRGCRFYDFLGIAPDDSKNHPWAGVTDFKKKFGGQVLNYPQAKDMVIRPFWYALYRFRKKLKN